MASYGGYYFAGTNKIYGPYQISTSVNSGANTRVTANAHGLAGTEAILVSGANNASSEYVILASADYTVVDANTIDILNVNWNANVVRVAKYKRDYTPGVDRVRTRITETCYLPGVTSGISTASDIPIPDVAMNDAQLVALLLANTTGYQTYDAQPLALWLGQIYRQALVEIDMSNL
jgi:hypothetical protein